MHFRDVGRQEPLTDERRLELMQARIEKLEKEGQRWGLIGGVMLAGISLLLVIVTMKKRPVDEVRATRYTLVNKAGSVRGYMTLGDFGPSLVLLGKDNKAKIVMGIDREGMPVFSLAGANGKDKIRIAVTENGAAGITLLDKEGDDRGWFGVDNQSGAGLNLYSVDGKPLAALTARGRYSAGLAFLNSRGRERAAIRVSGSETEMRLASDRGNSARLYVLGSGSPGLQLDNGRKSSIDLMITNEDSPRLILDDTDKGTRGSLQLSIDGRMMLTLQDKEGHAAVLGANRFLMGKNQTIVWSAP